MSKPLLSTPACLLGVAEFLTLSETLSVCFNLKAGNPNIQVLNDRIHSRKDELIAQKRNETRLTLSSVYEKCKHFIGIQDTFETELRGNEETKRTFVREDCDYIFEKIDCGGNGVDRGRFVFVTENVDFISDMEMHLPNDFDETQIDVIEFVVGGSRLQFLNSISELALFEQKTQPVYKTATHKSFSMSKVFLDWIPTRMLYWHDIVLNIKTRSNLNTAGVEFYCKKWKMKENVPYFHFYHMNVINKVEYWQAQQDQLTRGRNRIRLCFSHPVSSFHLSGIDFYKIKRIQILVNGYTYYDSVADVGAKIMKYLINTDIASETYVSFPHKQYFDPNKTINFSMIDSVYILIDTEETSSPTLTISALSYNYFRSVNGGGAYMFHH